MMKAIDHSDCPAEKCLLWERTHADLSEMELNQEFMKTTIDHINTGILRQTRLSDVNSQLLIADGVKMVKERLITLVWRLHNDLSNDIFDQKTESI